MSLRHCKSCCARLLWSSGISFTINPSTTSTDCSVRSLIWLKPRGLVQMVKCLLSTSKWCKEISNPPYWMSFLLLKSSSYKYADRTKSSSSFKAIWLLWKHMVTFSTTSAFTERAWKTSISSSCINEKSTSFSPWSLISRDVSIGKTSWHWIRSFIVKLADVSSRSPF